MNYSIIITIFLYEWARSRTSDAEISESDYNSQPVGICTKLRGIAKQHCVAQGIACFFLIN
ncbi:MAG: hypothetical protein WCT46_00530 [Candidatus Gracilibacteria bacterium]